MHSVNEDGTICVNLNDFNELSDSIRLRAKIDYLVETLSCPRDISNFSISMLFRGGQRYYISNLYLWAIPYRTEGLYRGDVDHDRSLYHGKEFFIQSDIKYDEMQIPIIQILESRYKLSTIFAMIRQCNDCDLIIEAYSNILITQPEKLYHQIRNKFETFIYNFIDAMQSEIIAALPNQKWLTILNDRGVKPSSINRILEIIRAILNRAHKVWGWVDSVPVIRMRKEENKRIRWLTKIQAERLINELPEHLKSMATFTLTTGLRESNVTQLKWSEIDLKRGHALIHPDESKTKRAIPVPLSKQAISIIEAQKGKNPVYVFTYLGKPVTRCNNHAWRKALIRAGIEDFRWHDLRHTWASWHVQNGTALYELQQLGGWSNYETVLRYAHLSSEHLKLAAERINVTFMTQ